VNLVTDHPPRGIFGSAGAEDLLATTEPFLYKAQVSLVGSEQQSLEIRTPCGISYLS